MSKNPSLKASYDSSPMCRVTLRLSLALLALPSLQHGKAPTSSSSSDSPCPTPATLQTWAQVKASGRNCSSWSEEGDVEPCLLVILPPFLSTLRLNPVYLLNRKLALSLWLLWAWVSGLYSTFQPTWQRPITVWDRSFKWPCCHFFPGLRGSVILPLNVFCGMQTEWSAPPDVFVYSWLLSYFYVNSLHCSLSQISCTSLFFHPPMFGGSWLSSSRDATHG